jgi:hypothetical protein
MSEPGVRYDGGRALGLDTRHDTTRQENQKRGPRGAGREGWKQQTHVARRRLRLALPTQRSTVGNECRATVASPGATYDWLVLGGLAFECIASQAARVPPPCPASCSTASLVALLR